MASPHTRKVDSDKTAKRAGKRFIRSFGTRFDPDPMVNRSLQTTQGSKQPAYPFESSEWTREHSVLSADMENLANQESLRSGLRFSKDAPSVTNSSQATQECNKSEALSRLWPVENGELWENLPSIVAEIQSRSTFLNETPEQEAQRFGRLPGPIRRYLGLLSSSWPGGMEMEIIRTVSGEDMLIVPYTGAVKFRKIDWNTSDLPNANSSYLDELDPHSSRLLRDNSGSRSLSLPTSELELINEDANDMELMPIHSKSVSGVLAERALRKSEQQGSRSQRIKLISWIKKIFTKRKENLGVSKPSRKRAEERKRSSFQEFLHEMGHVGNPGVDIRAERIKVGGDLLKQSSFHRFFNRISHFRDSGIDVSSGYNHGTLPTDLPQVSQVEGRNRKADPETERLVGLTNTPSTRSLPVSTERSNCFGIKVFRDH